MIGEQKFFFMNNFLLKEFQSKINCKLDKGEAEEFLTLLDEGVVVLDKNLKITYVNKKAFELLYTNKPIDNKILSFCEKLAILTYKKKHVYKKLVKDESSNHAFEISSIPRRDGNGLFLIFKDRTSEYHRLKIGKDFVANASHELRTPLTIIKGYCEMLSHFSKLDDKTIKEAVKKLSNTSLRLENIISDLLTLADIDNLQPHSFSECDLKRVIKNARNLVLLAHTSSEIILNLPDEHLTIHGNSGLIEMAVKNLIENAVRYSKAKPKIQISLKKESEFVELMIKDNGIGIPEKDLPFIFDRFFTVDKARSRKLGGSGLGLSLVKNIFEKHGCSIAVSSKLSVGSVFRILIPNSLLS